MTSTEYPWKRNSVAMRYGPALRKTPYSNPFKSVNINPSIGSAGFLLQSGQWLGKKLECDSIQEPLYLSDKLAPFVLNNEVIIDDNVICPPRVVVDILFPPQYFQELRSHRVELGARHTFDSDAKSGVDEQRILL